MLQVLLPAEFREQHRRIVLEFARRGHEFGRDEWRQAIVAFDLLKNGAILTDRGLLPFPVIYRQHIEGPYADDFIELLYTAARVDVASVSRWATVAREIRPRLTEAGLFRPDLPSTRLIVAYCLYWWRSFTLGYALEVEIQRDLQASGIRFQAHDLRRREERLSPFDLVVLGYREAQRGSPGDDPVCRHLLRRARRGRIARGVSGADARPGGAVENHSPGIQEGNIGTTALAVLYAYLYGLTRDDLAYILDTFPIVRRKDEEKYGEYRTRRMILENYDALRGEFET